MPAFHSRALLKSALLKGGLLKGSESWLEPHETRIERHSPSRYSTQLHYPTLSLWFLAVKILAQLVCSKLCQYCITCAHRTKKRRTTRQAASRYRAQIQTRPSWSKVSFPLPELRCALDGHGLLEGPRRPSPQARTLHSGTRLHESQNPGGEDATVFALAQLLQYQT